MDSKAYTEFGYRGAEEILLLNKEIDRLKKRFEGLEGALKIRGKILARTKNKFNQPLNKYTESQWDREIGWGSLPPENKYEKSDNYDINKIKLGRKIDNE